jgi:D-glycero-D-manno-heptose 1,7-bisphosphate phosphatase
MICFLDRDGVINEDIGYLSSVSNLEYKEDIFATLSKISLKGFKFIIITNQSGIGRGYYSYTDYLNLMSVMCSDFRSHNLEIIDCFHCPHHFGQGQGLCGLECDCRKPKAGMIKAARKKYNLDLQDCIYIGDRIIDEVAARDGGVGNYIIHGEVFKIARNFTILYDGSSQRLKDMVHNLLYSIDIKGKS